MKNNDTFVRFNTLSSFVIILKALQSLNKESFTKQLEEILLRFYKSTVQTRLHLKTSGAEKV